MRRGSLVPMTLLLLLPPAAGGEAVAQVPVPMAAREPPVLRGRVVGEADGRPVPRVRVRFDVGPSALTDEEGRFTVPGLPPGEHRVTLVTPACRSSVGVFRVEPGAAGEAEVKLPASLAREEPGPDFEPGQGKIVLAPEIEDMRARSLVDVLRRVAPEMVEQAPNQPGETTRLRGRNTATVGGRTEPMVVLDGAPQGNAPAVLRDIRPDEVAALQVLPGAAGGWMYGTSGGMIRIWTKRGRGPGAVGGPVDCPAWRDPGKI